MRGSRDGDSVIVNEASDESATEIIVFAPLTPPSSGMGHDALADIFAAKRAKVHRSYWHKTVTVSSAKTSASVGLIATS